MVGKDLSLQYEIFTIDSSVFDLQPYYTVILIITTSLSFPLLAEQVTDVRVLILYCMYMIGQYTLIY